MLFILHAPWNFILPNNGRPFARLWRGLIEAWGRGFDKIREACEEYGEPLPEYDISEVGVMVLCRACEKYTELLNDINKSKLHQNETGLEQVESEYVDNLPEENRQKKIGRKNRQKKSAEKIGR